MQNSACSPDYKSLTPCTETSFFQASQRIVLPSHMLKHPLTMGNSKPVFLETGKLGTDSTHMSLIPANRRQRQKDLSSRPVWFTEWAQDIQSKNREILSLKTKRKKRKEDKFGVGVIVGIKTSALANMVAHTQHLGGRGRRLSTYSRPAWST